MNARDPNLDVTADATIRRNEKWFWPAVVLTLVAGFTSVVLINQTPPPPTPIARTA